MKKLVVGVGMVCLVAGIAFGQSADGKVKTFREMVINLPKQDKHNPQPRIDAVNEILKMPGLNAADTRRAHNLRLNAIYIGDCGTMDFTATLAEVEDMMARYGDIGNFSRNYGHALLYSGRAEEAYQVFMGIVNDENANIHVRQSAFDYLIRLMNLPREEKQALRIRVLRECTVGQTVSRVIVNAFNQLDVPAMGKEAYIDLLNYLILAVPATEGNKEFLGRILSELEIKGK